MSKAIQKKKPIKPVALPADVAKLVEPGASGYVMGSCSIIVAHPAAGWHLSIACHHRLPTWDEVKAARYFLIPNEVTMAMLLPPVESYINLHEYCFQLWEVNDKRGDRCPVELPEAKL